MAIDRDGELRCCEECVCTESHISEPIVEAEEA
jgi:hypothetical protein